MTYYSDYVWKDRIPYGKGSVEPTHECCYKIVKDPYRKRFSIERYRNGKLDGVVYDSAIFDFRRLEPIHQMAWQREIIAETPHETQCIIRDQDDRAILVETQLFERNHCRQCHLKSLQGIFISTHRVLYISEGDAFDGVILYDANEHPVMIKRYKLGENGEFADLIEERWDFTQNEKPISL